MPITLTCSCGKRLKTAEENAGRKGKCPRCGTLVTFPFPEPETQFDPQLARVDPPPPEPETSDSLGQLLDDPSFPLPDEGSPQGDSASPAIQGPDPGDAHLAILGQIRDAMDSMLEMLRSHAPAAGVVGREAREYKVLTRKDAWSSGNFDPERVEGALNAYAKQGWVLRGVATASVPGPEGDRDELIIVMER